MASPVGVDPFITELWDSSIIPTLCDYIRIPNLSPDFDADCLTNGHMEAAFALVKTWVEAHLPVGAKVVLHEEPGKRTPFLHVDIAPFKGGKGHSLLYQHLDKQPWMRPWADGLDPTIPTIIGDKLYGRGGADDGYGIFASITAILDVQRRGLPHGHLSVVVEGAEESCRPCVPALVEHKGVPNPEPDLEYWIEKLKPQFGPIDLVICLDSGAATYDTMWLTDALRGVGVIKVEVETSKESIHSGLGGGVVPDPVRLLRILLERIEDTATGAVKVKALNVDIPDSVIKNLAPFKEIPNEEHMKQFSFQNGAHPGSTDNVELMLNATWKPSITVTGFDGCPSCDEGGNVIRPSSAMKLSIRIPPMADPVAAEKELKEILEADPPYGCKVTVTADGFCAGWKAPTLSPWLEKSLHRASNTAFGKPFGAFGCGGSIPFMGMLHDMFKEANFCITGVLGPESNAHGPNEFLHIPFAKGITSCISTVLEDHQNQE